MTDQTVDIRDEVKKHFKFKLIHQDKHCGARAGIITTPHGEIPTPVFMPVGTHGAMKALQPSVLKDMDTKIILSNTYHLHLSPGSELIAKAGGLHKYMGWDRPILTDSGGFQVFSLHGREITEEGALFKDQHGKKFMFSPETSIGIQQNLGSDIMMAFDECIPYPADMDYVENSIARTHRWLDRCIKAWTNPKQALFGIIQGSIYDSTREKCIEEVCSRGLPGYSIGGVSVGEGTELMDKIIQFTMPRMPTDVPRYAMGIGTPRDLFMLWENGVDMSDCIIPTKYARGGTLYTYRGHIRIRHQNYRRDFYPIEPNCNCYACQNFTRSYIKHLFDSNEILGQILATNHNIAFYKGLAEQAREAILEDRFLDFKREFFEKFKG